MEQKLLSNSHVLLRKLGEGEMTYDLAVFLFLVSTAVFFVGLITFVWRVKLERTEAETIRKKEKEALIRRLEETLQDESTRYFGYGPR